MDPLTVPTTDGALTGLANCDGQDVPLGPCHRFGRDVELHRFPAEAIGAAKTATCSAFIVLSTANGRYWARTSDPQLVDRIEGFAGCRRLSPFGFSHVG